LYFSLREKDSLIKCVMFASNVNRLNFVPSDGIQVIAKGRVTLYEKDGTYQLICESVLQDGVGDVSLQYKLLKEKLENEGLFDDKFKKLIPTVPQKIGVVTSRDGAALHDIINVVSRRYPLCEIIIFSSLVQGTEAPASIINAIKKADDSKCDTIIVGRGGGSKEDLEAFNNEMVARTVFALNTPCISAVGHETDFTIIDYVSDLRAPTPSAAAEIAVPNIDDILSFLNFTQENIFSAIKNYINDFDKLVCSISKKEIFTNANKLFGNYSEKLDTKEKLLKIAFSKYINDKNNVLNLSAARLNDLNPLNILSRGYSLVYNDGKLVKSAGDINENDVLSIKMSKDCAMFKVSDIKKVK